MERWTKALISSSLISHTALLGLPLPACPWRTEQPPSGF
jgi:hypothetical protein